MDKLSCIRSYDEQEKILEYCKQIHIDDEEDDIEFSNIKQTIDFILNVENPISANELKSINKKNQIKSSDQALETKLSHELEEYNIQKQFLTEKVEEKKKQIMQSKMENKRREAMFIISLRSIRDQICNQAKSCKSNS